MELFKADVLYLKTGKKNSNQISQCIIDACFLIINFNKTRLWIMGEFNYEIKAK